MEKDIKQFTDAGKFAKFHRIFASREKNKVNGMNIDDISNDRITLHREWSSKGILTIHLSFNFAGRDTEVCYQNRTPVEIFWDHKRMGSPKFGSTTHDQLDELYDLADECGW